jgi:hypothetical protein
MVTRRHTSRKSWDRLYQLKQRHTSRKSCDRLYQIKERHTSTERNIKWRSPENFFYITGQIFIAMVMYASNIQDIFPLLI